MSEIERNPDRRYNCLLIDTNYDYYICIPFRSHITHNNAFLFRHSIRSRSSRSGLDYSKIVIVNKSEYLGNPSVVDNDEYNEMIRNIERIVKEAIKYVSDYINHITGKNILNSNLFHRKYKYTTLRYFHTELGIG